MSENKAFTPPYCPNPKCKIHARKVKKNKPFYHKRGLALRKLGPPVQCYRCNLCHRSFNERSFSLNYRLHKTGHLNARIFFGVIHNRSNRSIARELNVSECLVRGRIIRLAKIAMGRHTQFLDQVRINEAIAYDGVECFARSQYEPNNINHAIGAKSLFCYSFNFSPLNRKGRMSERQKIYLEKLEKKEGRFDPRAIRRSSKEIFQELIKRKDPHLDKLTLYTDEHFQYRRALSKDLSPHERNQIDHVTVSSKASRTYKNILFPVNHMDLLLRRYLAAFSRETICFAKKASRMVHKYILFMCYKNYMKPQFVKAHKSNPKSNSHSPAMLLGLTQKLLEFHDFFSRQAPLTLCSRIPTSWNQYAQDKVEHSRHQKFKKTLRNKAHTSFFAHN